MLKVMRERAGSWFIKIVLGAIVIVFIFWGVGNFQSERFAKAAVVNGEPISTEAYQDAYNNMIEQYRGRFGNQMDEKMIQMLGIKKQALDQLIDQALLRQEAKKLKMKITDEELAENILKIPAFQQGGVFDAGVYRRVLSFNRLKPEDFEIMQRDALLADKLRRFVLETVRVSEKEAREWHRWNGAMVNLEYVQFKFEDYKEIDVPDEELAAYYEEHKASYKKEAQLKAQYVKFIPDDFMASLQVSDEEVKEYYDLNPDEFKTPKTVEARHILLKTASDATDEELSEKKEKAIEIMTLAKSGKDFGELAKQYSEDSTKDKGGYLGEFRKETMVEPFAEKAFSLAAGEISDPVKTQFGWHIIKVEKVNEASEKTFEQSTEMIRQKLLKEKAKSAAMDKAEAFYDAVFAGETLADASGRLSVPLNETGYFTRTGPEGVASKVKFARVAFELNDNAVSDVQDLLDAYYIIRVVEKIPEDIAPFPDVKEKVKADLTTQNQDEKAKSDAEAFIALSIKEGASWADVCKTSKKTPAETGLFKRNDPIPGLGREADITQAAFEMISEGAVAEKVIRGKSGYYVIRLKDRRMPESADFEKDKDSVKSQLLSQKQQKNWDAWIAQIRKEAAIVISENVFPE